MQRPTKRLCLEHTPYNQHLLKSWRHIYDAIRQEDHKKIEEEIQRHVDEVLGGMIGAEDWVRLQVASSTKVSGELESRIERIEYTLKQCDALDEAAA